MKKTDKEIISELKGRLSAMRDNLLYLKEENEKYVKWYRQERRENNAMRDSKSFVKSFYRIKYRCADAKNENNICEFTDIIGHYSAQMAIEKKQFDIKWSNTFRLINIEKMDV